MNWIVRTFIFFSFHFTFISAEVNRPYTITRPLDREDFYLPIIEYLKKYGYRGEKHVTVTRDGYYLILIRIGGNGRWPMLLLPGSFGNDDDWVHPHQTGDIEDTLGIRAYKAGFDVWLGNYRGYNSSYEKTHVEFSYTESRYWNFGLDEQAFYDVPALIDYILSTTRTEKLVYLGYSQSTPIFLMGMAANPEYNAKVGLFLAFAPSISSGNSTGLPGALLKAGAIFDEPFARSILTTFMPDGRFPPFFEVIDPLITPFISLYTDLILPFTIFISDSVRQYTVGYSPEKFYDDASRFVKFTPSSVRTLLQTLQLTKVSHAQMPRQYNFGINMNRRIYGKDIPPMYNISLVTCPVAIYYGENDRLVDPKDVEYLASILPNLVKLTKVNYPEEWNHFDFYLSTIAPRIVFKPMLRFVVDFLNKYYS